jgi:hypothetical protein
MKIKFILRDPVPALQKLTAANFMFVYQKINFVYLACFLSNKNNW